MDQVHEGSAESGPALHIPKMSATAVLRRWLQEATHKAGDISLPGLVDMAEGEFNDQFFRDLGRELLRDIIYDYIQRQYVPSRLRAKLDLDRLKAALAGKDPKWWKMAKSVFEDWYEETERGQKVAVIEMRKEQLRLAIEHRRKRASTELKTASWLETLAKKLKGNQRVKDAFSTEEIAREYLKAFSK